MTKQVVASLPYIACRLGLEQQQHPGASPARQHDADAVSSDSSSSSSSDGSDCKEDSSSDMTGITSSAVSISCENIRLQTYSSGTATTFSHPHRSAVPTLQVLLQRCQAVFLHAWSLNLLPASFDPPC